MGIVGALAGKKNMSGKNQIMAAGATILQVVDWDKAGDLQDILTAGNQGRLGRALTQWLASKGWLPPCPPPLVIDRSIPVYELGPRWPVWLGPADGNGLQGEPDVDPRAGEVKIFDASKAIFPIGFVGDETTITGEEKLKRLRAGVGIQVDAQTLWSLYMEKDQVTLRWLHEVRGIIWIEALGTILRDLRGYRHSLLLNCRDDGGWAWDFRWLDFGRKAVHPAISLAP